MIETTMKHPTRNRCLLLLIFPALLSVAVTASAEVSLPNVLGSGMVLQRDLPVPIWGWADPAEDVSVSFAGQTKSTTADDDGRWMVTLDPLKANPQAAVLAVAGNNKIALDDVLVGEVWICSGQSNMEWGLRQSIRGEEEVEGADHPGIRLFNVPGHTTSPLPQDRGAGGWEACSPESAGGFSGVGYFFGRRLQDELDVPVGLIGCNWGGTRIEPWTTLAGFESVPDLSNFAEQVRSYTAETDVGGGSPSAIYNSMVHPLAPFAMRGAIWYQGESNGGEGRSYYHKTQALVGGWRKVFRNENLAFYWVQLANYQQENSDPRGGDGWAKIREAQTEALDIPGTGMAVITDIGDAGDIHPRNKQDVGWRLAQWALHQTYGKQDLVPAGPLYKDHKVEDSAIRIAFKYVGKGLMAGKKTGLLPTEEVQDGKLEHFAIAGEDQKWFWAEATIDGDTVVVQSAEVPNPVAVRYGFTMNPASANLYNREGIPACPFRTDRWLGPSEELPWLAVADEPPPKSVPGASTTVFFENKSSDTVKVYWVQYGGGLKFYGNLEPGATREQSTFSDASWLITDEADKPLGYFRTTQKAGFAVIPKQ